MKSVLRALLAAALVCVTPQIAQACYGVTQLSQQDIAFADVIFEGRIKKISDTSRHTELTFDVHNVVRGVIEQGEVTIGWGRSPFHVIGNGDVSIEAFIDTLGETTRVAMSTPKLASKFCELKLRGGNFYDEDTGTHVFDKRMQPVCNPRLNSLDDAFRENVPFVLSNSYFCGSSYLFSVEQYNKMRNYEKNLAAFEAAIEDGSLVPNSELFLKKVGAFGQLPWKFNGSTPRAIATTIAIDLVRRHEGYFIPSLKDNAAWQASLLDIGEATMMRESFLLGNKYKQDEAARIKFRETLREEILRLSSYIEKDPEFRDRLLQED